MKTYTVKTKWSTIVGPASSQVYGDGTLALIVGDEVVSINLGAYGMEPPAGHVFVKNYSEHEGLPDELERVGLVKKIQEVPIGYGSGWLCQIVGEVRGL